MSPLTGSSEHAVRNSASFVDYLRNQTIGENEVMVSFDVESLFTNVPIESACRVALQRMQTDVGFSARTSLSPGQVAELLEFVLKSTYFMYNGEYYEQQEGAAMGSPVSAVVANLYMENFEEQALEACPDECAPRVWKRYVDDTFIVTQRSTANDLLSFMNAQQPSIRFTMEVENDNRIAFLDTLVHRDTNGRLSTTVYRKPTHTDQYLAFDSHHPRSVKRGVVKCLYDRALRTVTKPACTATEKRHVRSALISNGYPRSFIQRVAKQKRATTNEPASYKATVVLPFVEGVSQQLRRRLENHGIRAVFKSDTTIRKHLVRPKDPALPDRRDGVVYKIPCGNCDKVYIGETGRPVGERMLEHRRDVRLMRTDGSAVAEHAYDADHPPNWGAVRCIAYDKHWYSRRVKEAIQIRLHPNNINRDSGIDIPEAWLPTIRRHAPPAATGGGAVPLASVAANSSTASAPNNSGSVAAPTNHGGAPGAVNARDRYKRRVHGARCTLPDEG